MTTNSILKTLCKKVTRLNFWVISEKKLNNKRKKPKTKIKFSNESENILNSNKENTNSENISIPTSKALNSFQNAKEKIKLMN